MRISVIYPSPDYIIFGYTSCKFIFLWCYFVWLFFFPIHVGSHFHHYSSFPFYTSHIPPDTWNWIWAWPQGPMPYGINGGMRSFPLQKAAPHIRPPSQGAQVSHTFPPGQAFPLTNIICYVLLAVSPITPNSSYRFGGLPKDSYSPREWRKLGDLTALSWPFEVQGMG